MEEFSERLDGIRPGGVRSFKEPGPIVLRPGEYVNPEAVPDKEDLELLLRGMAESAHKLEQAWKAYEQKFGFNSPPASDGYNSGDSARLPAVPSNMVEKRCAKCAIM
jgi:hypothetical protein